jgi:hypothetical protein
MFSHFRSLWFVTAAVLVVALSGCPANRGNTGSGAGETEEHGHEHGDNDHGHSHDEGPSGGHIIPLGDEEYHVEWLHDDEEGVLTFIILDASMENQVPIPAENLVVQLTLENDAGEQQTQEVLIPAEAPVAGKTARFSLADKAAMFNITENEKVDAVLKVTIDGKDFSEKIEHDAHHGHSHSHD